MTNGIAKVVRDGKVAVLRSRGFGAGWYSWNTENQECLYSPEIVAMVEAGTDWHEIAKRAGELWPDSYWGGAEGLTIEWIPQGTAFEIHEYNGAESVEYASREWLIA